MGQQGTNRVPGLTPELPGRGLGGDSRGRGPLTDGARRRLDRTGGLGGGPAGIREARGAACARGPVRSCLSRVGPGARRRAGRGGVGGAGGTRHPPLPKPRAQPLAPPGGQREGAFAKWVRLYLNMGIKRTVTAATIMMMRDFSEFRKLPCSQLSLAPVSLKVKAKPGGPQDPAGSASPSAPRPSPPSLPPCPPCSLSSSHCGLLAVPPTHQNPSNRRAFALADPSTWKEWLAPSSSSGVC